jgi:hypothetical protein
MRHISKNSGLWIALFVMASAWAQDPAAWLARETADDYRARARYPENSRVIEAGDADPILLKRIPTPHSAGNAADFQVHLWPGKVSFETPYPVTLFAAVTSAGEPWTGKAEIIGEIVGNSGEVIGTVTYLDNGLDEDETAGDGTYTARFDVPYIPELAENFLVKMTAIIDEGPILQTSGGFLYSNPAARLTDRFQEEVRDGNLVISVEIDVAREGRFHLAGTLYTKKGDPLGWAQTAEVLTPGTHWLELSYYGLMFHERNASGPFRLGTLALTTTGAMPNAFSDVVENAYITESRNITDFRSTSFEDPDLMETVRRIEARISEEK